MAVREMKREISLRRERVEWADRGRIRPYRGMGSAYTSSSDFSVIAFCSSPIGWIAYPVWWIACPVRGIAYPVRWIAYPVRWIAYPVWRIACPVRGMACPSRLMSYLFDRIRCHSGAWLHGRGWTLGTAVNWALRLKSLTWIQEIYPVGAHDFFKLSCI